ncbi:dTDP-glucose 4,6-dehydratase [Methylacidimicrobium cyclopophantes]|uniref:dTDP-glucose 4,6-dehydratase n=1 Tax=Methylacidimicrobium cyclopophantes TaxID=1041766 RepID=A0A5E6MD81_9BACT|nr:dTDP-glucose 4,6-dehydratase [Methylacidimicrobium cyclopophantes]VVM06920.1 dTDP-glucose 4,6-dehydratase [Methylacidimicrobium cyclopophantes]
MRERAGRWLITGGAGFIGSNFLHLIFHEGPRPERAVTLDKLAYAGRKENLAGLPDEGAHQFVQGEIGDQPLVGRLLRENRVEGVIHFAAETHVDRSIESAQPFVETNVVGSWRLLEAAWNYWRELPREARERFRFLHVSTDEVYGSIGLEEEPTREGAPYDPSSPYAASKAASDHFVRAYAKTFGFPAMVTHCSNNYGPRQFPEKMIPLMILNLFEGKPLPIYGDGSNRRDWIYVEDHCRALREVLLRGKPGETYHIGSGSGCSNRELVEQLCVLADEIRPRASGRSYRDLITYVTDRPGHDFRYAVDSGKIRRELGWKPRETLEDGLRKTIDWYRENGEWCERIRRDGFARERLGLLRG